MFSVFNTDPTTEAEYEVQFPSKEEKDAFIQRERKFCGANLRFLLEAKSKYDRDKFKRQLFNKRMEFLKKENFQPQGALWIKSIEDQIEDQFDPDDPEPNDFKLV